MTSIQVFRVPQYMSKNVNVIMVNGKPFCTCRGQKTTANVIARLQGYNTELTDKRIERMVNGNGERVNDDRPHY